ncbi:hypothetical protein OEZ49_18170 [Ruegeria sp. WL0004]|uniref:Uncharacterized protein n=1 Tax=Ruegeria marisflavi TaxID=2984152 RepID=A0ABT2WUY5_9RHOB|nr:hypothetical protein [Ruegeria sp. WL0004]
MFMNVSPFVATRLRPLADKLAPTSGPANPTSRESLATAAQQDFAIQPVAETLCHTSFDRLRAQTRLSADLSKGNLRKIR